MTTDKQAAVDDSQGVALNADLIQDASTQVGGRIIAFTREFAAEIGAQVKREPAICE